MSSDHVTIYVQQFGDTELEFSVHREGYRPEAPWHEVATLPADASAALIGEEIGDEVAERWGK